MSAIVLSVAFLFGLSEIPQTKPCGQPMESILVDRPKITVRLLVIRGVASPDNPDWYVYEWELEFDSSVPIKDVAKLEKELQFNGMGRNR